MWIALAFFLLLLAVGVTLLPFFRTSASSHQDITIDPRLHALFTKRDQLYQSIREAKFDLDTGKLSPEDYESQVAALKRQAANVLKAIDKYEVNQIPQEWNEKIEQQVRTIRRQSALNLVMVPSKGATGSSRTRYCPKCGTRVNAGDHFCPACGVHIA